MPKVTRQCAKSSCNKTFKSFSCRPKRFCSRYCGGASHDPNKTIKEIIIEKSFGTMSGCVIWDSHKINSGYGIISIQGKVWLIHRYVWFLSNGPILDGIHICHKCDHKLCINIDHLFPGTRQDNMDDMVRKNRQAKGSKNGRSKFTEGDIRQFRRFFALGISMGTMADTFGIPYKYLHKVVKSNSWNHVSP